MKLLIKVSSDYTDKYSFVSGITGDYDFDECGTNPCFSPGIIGCTIDKSFQQAAKTELVNLMTFSAFVQKLWWECSAQITSGKTKNFDDFINDRVISVCREALAGGVDCENIAHASNGNETDSGNSSNPNKDSMTLPIDSNK